MSESLLAAERSAAYILKNAPVPPAQFQKRILAYYERHGRDLPWRHTRDPYRILISEVMLQQTQVSRVIEKYELFIRLFPDFYSLANAGDRELLAAWSGLGYNRRALYLRACARSIDQCGGIAPLEWQEFKKLPGIGEATAKAICVYAYDEPLAYIETNIRTVFIHSFFHDSIGVEDSELLPLIERYLYRKKPSVWFHALMDYGTALKKIYGNVARKSASWKKQSAFAGSDRQLRGEIVRLVVEKQKISLSEILKLIKEPERRIVSVIRSLERDALLSFEGSWLSVDRR